MPMSKTSKNLSKGGKNQSRFIRLAVVAAIAVFGLSGWAWWHYVRSNPERTFYAAIENNLRTHSLTRNVTQESGPQQLEQDIELTLSPEPLAHGFTSISQSGQGATTVDTESISTPNQEFVRYTTIDTKQKNASGDELHFEELLNIWGRTSTEGASQTGELYGESILGVVPTANLTAGQRGQLMQTISENNVYQFEGSAVKRTVENGRPTYVYDVTVAPSAYITLLKQFGGMVGLRQLEGLDPAQYEGAQALQFKLTVDVWSQRLTGIEFAGGERIETTSSFGIHHDVEFPEESIPVEELQAKLQQVQQ